MPEYTNIFVVLVIMTSFVNNLNAPVSFVVHATGVMNKYQIEASNYLVDIIYEAIILESNNEKVNNE